jgi:hypothetical protein
VALPFSIEITSQKPYYLTSNPETGTNPWLRSTLWSGHPFEKQMMEKTNGKELILLLRHLAGRPMEIPGG